MVGSGRTHVEKDGRSWPLAGPADVAWIFAGTRTGPGISAAVPPVFDAYATIVTPDASDHPDELIAADQALVQLLLRHGGTPSWWLGYLETGVSDVVFPDAPRLRNSIGWPYVVIRAGPAEASGWRDRAGALPWHSALPELIWPVDRAWLTSELWDDDWRCVGGTVALIDDLLADDRLQARRVAPGEDATPPGHHYI